MLYRIVVLGDGGIGKTALTIQFCLNHFVETYDPTIEDSYRKQVTIDGEPCVMEVLDTAGQEEYTALRDQWIRDGEGFLLVWSLTCRDTFDRLKIFRERLRRVKESDEMPILLVGNKSDATKERRVTVSEAQLLARQMGAQGYVEVSAKYNTNVEMAFFDIVRAVRAQRAKQYGGYKEKPTRRKTRYCNIL